MSTFPVQTQSHPTESQSPPYWKLSSDGSAMINDASFHQKSACGVT